MAELTNRCCTRSAQATCCDAADKAECCSAQDPDGCGCAAGRQPAAGATRTGAQEIRETVRDKYAEAARAAGRGHCCRRAGPTGAFGAQLYDEAGGEQLPDAAVQASLGCGVPTAVADLHEGETVLDLGSGAGVDVLISARRVGPSGKAIGVDMTDEMLELARRNAVDANVDNVELRKGFLERLPLADASVDVIISNCVINLSSDKPRVLAEAARVLKPGGRFAASDVPSRPQARRRDDHPRP